MSKGTIRKPRNPKLPDNLSKKPLEDIIYYVAKTCEVDVDNSEWQKADEILKNKLKNLQERIDEIDKRLGSNQGNLSDQIKELKSEIHDLKNRKPLDLVVKIENGNKTDLGKQHKQLPTLLKVLATKLNVYLVGPAGSGKTFAAIQCAKALNVDFYFTGAIASEFKLTGFIDAQGRIVSTEFRKAYENGGLFLFDEIDASYPQAVLAFNAALSNDYMDFPDKRVQRHKDFYCIAAANTFGQGADRQYIGRNQLDAASLDRFVFMDWEYDENLERELAGNENWSNYVQKIRRFITYNKIRHVISPRASIFGARLLATGLNKDIVEETVLWKGLEKSTVTKIKDNIKPIEIRSGYRGIFIPNVKVNQKVEEGDILGTFKFSEYDPDNEFQYEDFIDEENYDLEEYDIESEYDGVILSVFNKNTVIEKDKVLIEISRVI